MNLKTKYLGLELKNPIIAASSKLTGSIDKIAELEEKGAAAVVVKSLFEEQILLDTQKMVDSIDTSSHAEAFDLFSGSAMGHFMDEYLNLIDQARKKSLYSGYP
jgi:dihydroorotate dehydrogenase (fumarate)